MATDHVGSGDLRRSLELLWGTPEPPGRGPRPGLSLDRMVRAGIEVADAEGLAAVSMRRIAGALDVGVMSLYRYVPGKAELIDLMVDALYAEDIDDARSAQGDWRTLLADNARREYAFYLRHPWLLQIAQGRPLLGPNAMRSTDIALRAVDGLGLDEHEMLSVIVMLSSYVSGLARTVVDAMQAAERTGISDDEWWQVHEAFLSPAVLAGELPMMQKVGEAGAFASEFDTFEFGLQRILDGLAALVEARGHVKPPL